MEGQTVREGMEVVTKDNGIKFGAFRAGDIQGNGCRKLMSCGGEIRKYMTDFLQSMSAGQKNCSDEEIGELFGVYTRLLGHLEAFFSIFFQETVLFKLFGCGQGNDALLCNREFVEIPEYECDPKVASFDCSFVEISGMGKRIQ